MKGKFLFILPRLIGVTLLIGLASLILGFVFRLLVGLIIIGSIAFLIANMVRKMRKHRSNNAMMSLRQGNDNLYAHGFQNQYRRSSQATIVPIN